MRKKELLPTDYSSCELSSPTHRGHPRGHSALLFLQTKRVAARAQAEGDELRIDAVKQQRKRKYLGHVSDDFSQRTARYILQLHLQSNRPMIRSRSRNGACVCGLTSSFSSMSEAAVGECDKGHGAKKR